jgi:DNA polymerase-4
VGEFDIISAIAKKLLSATEPEGKKIRLLGVTLSNFGQIAPKQKKTDHPNQLALF